MESQEAKLYLVPFDTAQRPVYWFNDDFCANSWSRPHAHPWGELAYTGHGGIVICTEYGNWLAPPHRAIWIPAGLRHEWYVPCDAKDCSLWIDQSVLLGVERFTRCHMLKITPLVREILLYLTPQPSVYGDDARGRLIVTLLDLLLDLPEVTDPQAMPRDHRLLELCTILLTTPGEASTLSEWAGRLGMSERNLGRLFRRETGTSFRSWRQFQRMQSAHARLRQGESVTAVALDCGYSSVSAFIATFKEHFGFTPGKVAFGGHGA
ncbi:MULTISPECIES: helix-turn-helix transcriptional regulator [unclassified Desulfovibrio]|uniref:helix-turn-helix transcriptional regulator n=1 Tax=unclassified Desulfovibrio TaxID=2593640 RepID=UPI0013EAC0D5|nr:MULTISPECIES: helix-turn-helix transcriptional regulator [unclassified Desulfovibrio]